jgi:azurin
LAKAVVKIVKKEYSDNCKMDHRNTKCDLKCKQYTINVKYTTRIDHPKKKLKGKFA